MNRIAFLYCFILLVGVATNSSCELSHEDQRSAPDPVKIPGIHSDQTILADFVLGATSSIHVVAQTKEEGLFYIRSGDSGRTWSSPNPISGSKSFDFWKKPRIFLHDQAILIIWRDRDFHAARSVDSGHTWHTETLPISRPGSLINYSFLGDGKLILLVGNTSQELLYFRSSDFGVSWSSQVTITAYNPGDLNVQKVSVDKHSDSIYVLCSVVANSGSVTDGIMRNANLVLCTSHDLGTTWGSLTSITTDRTKYGPIYKEVHSFVNPRIFAIEDSLYVFYEERGLFFQSAASAGDSWTSPVRVSDHPSRMFNVTKSTHGELFVAWIDNRNQKKDWWGSIPLHEAVTMDKDPNWVNNDLFLSRVHNSVVDQPIRLSGLQSFVCFLGDVLPMNSGNDQLYILWAGREKVGKTVDEFGFPVEVFLGRGK